MSALLEYENFLENKFLVVEPAGIVITRSELNPKLFDFQKDIVHWSLKLGKSAIFADCGMGKTLMQLEWSKHVHGTVLILAPLAVSGQTVREGKKFGIEVKPVRSQEEVGDSKIVVANYEILHKLDPKYFKAVVLDESSILKSMDGKTRDKLIESFRLTPFKLACTATPSPNDYMELGNHAEFLNVMTRSEMLAMYFTHDGGETQKWRIKGHAKDKFWKWVCSWAVMMTKPSDLGYDDDGFNIPPIEFENHFVEIENTGNYLFPMEASTLSERISARRETLDERCAACANIVNQSKEPFIVWCNLNGESELLSRLIPDAVEIKGSDDSAVKEERLVNFTDGVSRVLISKPSICGFGMNWQHCRNQIFVGLNDSYEQYYQAIRRSWRFGQDKTVYVHTISTLRDGSIAENLRRKERNAQTMKESMVKNMVDFCSVKSPKGKYMKQYTSEVVKGREYTAIHGDCVEEVAKLDSDSIDFSIYSPPFASLYTYSDSERDMGNCKGNDDFFEHYRYLIQEMYRVIKPGRHVAIHCMDMPTSKTRDGYIGIRDFGGDIIREHEKVGFIYHTKFTIWKDPVTAMQRTKALGLLYKQLKKDSAMSRAGIPDYVVVMRKPGENAEPIRHDENSLPCSLWQKYASPVWDDINPSDTLQYRSARDNNDERHVCPLQLSVIKRPLHLYTNENDLVLSPFMGIGSEGVVSIQHGRRFIGVELKKSYFDAAVTNMNRQESVAKALLF